jgi:quercetin 2,3-dioxygenase
VSLDDGALHLIAAPAGRGGAVTVHQDAELWVARLGAGADVSHTLARGRHAWLQVARGDVTLNGTALHAGDGVAVSDESLLKIHSDSAAEVLLFDLA